MNYSLDYYSTYGTSGKIYVRCLGGDERCKVRYYLYDSNGLVKKKTAYDDELVMFYYPCTSVYKIYADVYPDGCDKITLSTGDINVSAFDLFPPEYAEVKAIKGPLSLVSDQDNFLVIKFVKGGLKKLKSASSAVVPTYYQLRHVIKFVPAFDNAVLNKVKKYSPELESFKYEYIVHPQIDPQLLLALGNELQRLDYVEYCDLQGVLGDTAPEAGETMIEPVPPVPTNTATPNFMSQQGYLFGGRGMDVQSVWNRGITGQNFMVHIRDTGNRPHHEDLGGIVERSVSTQDPDHGAASSGAIIGRNNSFGVVGIAYNAQARSYNNAEVGMTQVMADSLPGDVVTMSLGNIVNNISVPIINSRHRWDQIRSMVNAGVVVVIAAGNGGINLQHAPFVDHGDSGVIMVGAAAPASGRRLSFSNFNFRRFVNAWGTQVTTCGYGTLFGGTNVNRRYTNNYTGTSAATPLVAGVLALIQSYARTTYRRIFNNQQMFSILHNTGARLGEGDLIGRSPVVSAAIAYVDLLLGGTLPPPEPLPPVDPGPQPPYPEWGFPRSYSVGDRVRYRGNNYECIIALVANSVGWSPSNTPQVWRRLSSPGDPGPQPPFPEWGFPRSYSVGDRVRYRGNNYECILAHVANSVGWSPINTPQAWRLLGPS